MSLSDNIAALIQGFTRRLKTNPATVTDALNIAQNLEGVNNSLNSGTLIADTIISKTAGAGTSINGILIQPTEATAGLHVMKMAKVTYDFDVVGGGVGTYGTGVILPNRSIITKVYFDVITALTSSGTTGTLRLENSVPTNLTNEIASDGTFPVDQYDGIPNFAAANMVKNTSDQELMFLVAHENLTAGKVVFFVYYNVSA